MRLENKIGIVTAAASGMGRAGALRFAAEGASVAVVDLNAEATDAVVRQITAAGGKAIGLSGDLTSDAFARDIVRQTVKQFGGLDFVWNHVGTPGPASIEGLDWKEFDFAMNLNAAVGAGHNRGGAAGTAGPRRRVAAVHRLDLRPAGVALQPGLQHRQVRRRRAW